MLNTKATPPAEPCQAVAEAALEWAADGFSVFPVRPGAKQPLLKGGFHAASADAEAIRDWWRRWPCANLGLPCGQQRLRADGTVVHHFVLDVDRPEVAEALAQDQALLQQAWAVRTPGKKGLHLHLFARKPVGVVPLVDHVGAHVGEVRGRGGYVLLPPSRLPEGVYDWLSGPGFEPITVDDALRWATELLAQFGVQARPAAGSRGEALDLSQPIPVGRRDITLFRAFRLLVSHGMAVEDAAQVVRVLNQTRTEEPLPAEELERQLAKWAGYPFPDGETPAEKAARAQEHEAAPPDAGRSEPVGVEERQLPEWLAKRVLERLVAQRSAFRGRFMLLAGRQARALAGHLRCFVEQDAQRRGTRRRGVVWASKGSVDSPWRLLQPKTEETCRFYRPELRERGYDPCWPPMGAADGCRSLSPPCPYRAQFQGGVGLRVVRPRQLPKLPQPLRAATLWVLECSPADCRSERWLSVDGWDGLAWPKSAQLRPAVEVARLAALAGECEALLQLGRPAAELLDVRPQQLPPEAFAKLLKAGCPNLAPVLEGLRRDFDDVRAGGEPWRVRIGPGWLSAAEGDVERDPSPLGFLARGLVVALDPEWAPILERLGLRRLRLEELLTERERRLLRLAELVRAAWAQESWPTASELARASGLPRKAVLALEGELGAAVGGAWVGGRGRGGRRLMPEAVAQAQAELALMGRAKAAYSILD